MPILITGGTGYVGRAVVAYALIHCSGVVRLLSRSESGQAQMRGEHNDERLRWMIGDVRDRRRVRRAMRDCSVVIHAAALKRIEVGAYDPAEMVATNVLGTQHVAEEAEEIGARCVVVSSDKACEPVSAYGQSKAIAESLALANHARVVRFGNIAGSTGSVIPTWRSLIAKGATSVPVTDPDCTRYWMWAHDAAQLIWRAAYSESSGIISPVLPAYRLGDLAEAMGVGMDVRGLPAHEKLHESMIPGVTSDTAERLTVAELREMLKRV